VWTEKKKSDRDSFTSRFALKKSNLGGGLWT
jgi:hypothetical protein